MPDISKCDNTLCPLRENCYRFTCVANKQWQSYAGFKPDKDGKCDYYWPVKPENQTEKTPII